MYFVSSPITNCVYSVVPRNIERERGNSHTFDANTQAAETQSLSLERAKQKIWSNEIDQFLCIFSFFFVGTHLICLGQCRHLIEMLKRETLKQFNYVVKTRMSKIYSDWWWSAFSMDFCLIVVVSFFSSLVENDFSRQLTKKACVIWMKRMENCWKKNCFSYVWFPLNILILMAVEKYAIRANGVCIFDGQINGIRFEVVNSECCLPQLPSVVSRRHRLCRLHLVCSDENSTWPNEFSQFSSKIALANVSASLWCDLLWAFLSPSQYHLINFDDARRYSKPLKFD